MPALPGEGAVDAAPILPAPVLPGGRGCRAKQPSARSASLRADGSPGATRARAPGGRTPIPGGPPGAPGASGSRRRSPSTARSRSAAASSSPMPASSTCSPGDPARAEQAGRRGPPLVLGGAPAARPCRTLGPGALGLPGAAPAPSGVQEPQVGRGELAVLVLGVDAARNVEVEMLGLLEDLEIAVGDRIKGAAEFRVMLGR